MRTFFLCSVLLFIILFTFLFFSLLDYLQKPEAVTVNDLKVLVNKAEAANQPYLQSIFLTIKGAMLEGTVTELNKYTSAFNQHAILYHPHTKIKRTKNLR